jgi:Xaa-Pro aminopeptidase
MKDYFSKDFFRDNRKRLRTLFQGIAPIVLTANGLLQKSNDSTYKFKQDGNFWYLTGLESPDLILVIDKEKEYLILPEESQAKQDFYGAIDIKQLQERSGIETVLDAKRGWRQLSARLQRVKHVATIAPPQAYMDVFGYYTNPARAVLVQNMKELNPELELLDLRQQFALMRTIKRPEEIAALRHAIRITSETLQDIQKNISKFSHEYEIEAALSHGFRFKGANGHAFDPIVAAGRNACIIHYEQNNCSIHKKELLLLDVGAEVLQYAADISRTYAIQEPTKRQQQIHTAVLEVQDYAFGLLKPGVLLAEYEQQVTHFMGEKLRSLGLIKNVEESEMRKYFPHATSHFLGYDVHDVGDYSRPLEPGVVLTVEPGIYIAEEGIGVRIEDDVLVTETGIEILTRSLSRDL